MKCRWNRTMLNLCGIVVAILKMVTARNFSISGINSGHHYLPTYQILMIIGQCWIFAAILKMATARNFSMSGINSGHHNLPTCEMALKSDNVEFVLYCGSHFWKWWPLEIFQCREWIRHIIIYPHMKYRWNWTMLNLCGIVVAILKMATARNFSMSGIYLGHHNLPINEMSLKSDNVEFVRYCGGHFENDDL